MTALPPAQAADIQGLYTDVNQPKEFAAKKSAIYQNISKHATSSAAGHSLWDQGPQMAGPAHNVWGPCGARPNEVLQWAQESRVEDGKVILTFTGVVINKTPGASPSEQAYENRVILSNSASYRKSQDGQLIRESDELVRDSNGRVIVQREGVEKQELTFELSPDKKSIVKMTYQSTHSVYATKDGQLDGAEEITFKSYSAPTTCFDVTSANAGAL